MKTNKKFFSFFLILMVMASMIFPSFADGIQIKVNGDETYKKDTYRSGQWITLTAEDGKDGYMKWYGVDENGKRTDWSPTSKVIDNHYIDPFNDTGKTVSTVVYAVYETVTDFVYQSVEIPVEPDPKPLKLVDMYPKFGEIGVKKDAEISLIFNQPVELNEDNKNSRKFRIIYDANKDGKIKQYYPSRDAVSNNKLIFSEETPEKVTLQICDKNGNPIQLQENHNYKINVYPFWIQAKDYNPYIMDHYSSKDMIRYTFNTKVIPESIKINSPDKTIYAGESFQLTVAGVDDEGKEVKDYQPIWGTSNPNVAMVSPEGVLRARTAGKVTIYASIEGKEDQKEAIEIEIKKENEYSKRIKAAIDGAAEIAIDNHHSMDWVTVGLARSGKSDEIPENYVKNIEEKLKDNNGEFPNKPTEYERMTLGLLAAGKNPRNIVGYDLIEKIYNADLEDQGINSIIYGLIALDAGEYKVPKDAEWTRKKLINYILENECDYEKDGKEIKGGWALKAKPSSTPSSDPDITGMAMTALAPYNNDKYPKVKAAIDRAIEYLSAVQEDSGGYFSWDSANSESCSQAIMGLCINGIDPTSDEFTKNGNNLIDGLLSFELSDHSGFAHMIENDELKFNGMANEQALYSLTQYMYYLEGKGSIYHWGKDNIAPTIEVKNLPNEIVSEDDTLEFEVYAIDNRDGSIVPKVKFDNQVVTKNKYGKYEIQLKEGKNTIIVSAVDTLNNKVEKKYTITRYKQNYQLGQKIQLIKNTPIKLEGKNGQIDIDLGDVGLEKDATLCVEDETENKEYQPSEDTGLKAVGQIVNFDFKGVTIDEKHSATIKLSLKEGIDPTKASIYYFNDQTKKWEYVHSIYEDENLVAKVNHFSVYGILEDTKGPENVKVQSKSINSNKVLLSMSAQDASGIKEYHIFKNDFEKEPITKISKNEYLDTKVIEDQNYKYRIKAVDSLGNISDFSEVLEIITPKKDSNIPQPPKPDSKKVYIRVEGYDHTIIPRTQIDVSLFNLNEYLGKATGSSAKPSTGWDVEKFNKPTNAHAIVKALTNHGLKKGKGKGHFDFQDYGSSLYMAMIDGNREFDHKGLSGWMYRVNDVLPNIGCNAKELKDGDEIVWYYTPYGFEGVYTKIFADETSVSINDEVKIKLNGYEEGYKQKKEAVSGATILVNEKPYIKDGKEVVTDDKGNAVLKFDQAGVYSITATRKDQQGLIDIVRPNPVKISVRGTTNPQKPLIAVTGIMNGETIDQSEITFSVVAKDYKGEKLTPVVKCNDEILTEENNQYNVKLKEGKNNIFIQAEDKENNVSQKLIKITCTEKDENVSEIVVPLPNEDKPKIEISGDENNYKIDIKKDDHKKEIEIVIPETKESKVILDLPSNCELPKIEAHKGDISAVIPKGVKITNGNTKNIEMITSKKDIDDTVKNNFDNIIPQGKKLQKIEKVFSMGTSEKIVFSDFITLTFNGMKGKEVAYIQNGNLVKIKKYENDVDGKNINEEEYAYEEENNLIVKTKHFTDFIVYSLNDDDNSDIKSKVKEQLNKHLPYILETVEKPWFGNEWEIICLGRGNYPVPDGYYDQYYNNVAADVKELMKKDPVGKLHINKGTEHSRLILGLTAIGKDITNVEGYDIRKALADFKYITKQGINGPIFALIALESKNYEIPIDKNIKEQTTKEKLIEYILDREINKGKENAGGWSLESQSDIDVTAMAIQALTPYYHKDENVKAAVDRAIHWLSSVQREDGGYASWGSINSESCAQVIVALTGLGIDPHTDDRFIKNGNSVVDALMTFAAEDGGFMHVKASEVSNGGGEPGKVNGMATYQGTYALVAYDRFINRNNRLYDMTDVEEKETIEIVVEGLTEDMSVNTSKMSFKAYVKDQKGSITVGFNKETIKEDDGQYNVTLKEGENTIVITAIDEEQNKVEKIYKVYYVVKNLFEITTVSKNDFKNGSEAQIQIKAKNISDQEREATLIVTLYNEENELVHYGFVHKNIKNGEEEELDTGFLVPQAGKYRVKAFVWDNMKNMNILCKEPIIVEVKEK